MHSGGFKMDSVRKKMHSVAFKMDSVSNKMHTVGRKMRGGGLWVTRCEFRVTSCAFLKAATPFDKLPSTSSLRQAPFDKLPSTSSLRQAPFDKLRERLFVLRTSDFRLIPL
jgi:hypothetical protein